VRPSPLAEEIWNGYVSLGTKDGREAFLHTLRSVVDITGQRVSATDRLYLAQEVPTLIVWGERDPLIPAAHGRRAHRSMPGSAFKLYRDVGHFPHCDEPDRFVDDLTSFIDSTKPARPDVDGWQDLIRTATARRPARPKAVR
jgi:pimeloyl-ACP methyl ester carboxylesterase